MTRTASAKFVAPTWVYFLRAVDTDYVKIGVACSISSRITQLQTGSPHELVCVGWVLGGKELELELQKRFRSSRVRNEWFRFSGPIEDYVSALPEEQRGIRRRYLVREVRAARAAGEEYP